MLTEQEQEKLKALAKFTSMMPTPKPLEETVMCACGKYKPASEVLTPFHTGVIDALDNVCKGCEKEWKDQARIVCVSCRTVVARMDPCMDKKTGFRLDKGRTYHIDECGSCHIMAGGDSSVPFESVCIEKKLFEDKIK